MNDSTMHWHENDLRAMTPQELADYCRSAPAYVTERDDFDYTPLIAACGIGNVAAARVLLNAGADPNFIAPDDESPLKAAIPRRGEPFNRELFDLLFSAGADPNRGLEPALHMAVVRGHRDLVRYLVEHGADPNMEDADGSPPLFWAGAYSDGPPDILTMRLLIQLGADITRRDGVGQTTEQRVGPEALREALRSSEE